MIGCSGVKPKLLIISWDLYIIFWGVDLMLIISTFQRYIIYYVSIMVLGIPCSFTYIKRIISTHQRFIGLISSHSDPILIIILQTSDNKKPTYYMQCFPSSNMNNFIKKYANNISAIIFFAHVPMTFIWFVNKFWWIGEPDDRGKIDSDIYYITSYIN